MITTYPSPATGIKTINAEWPVTRPDKYKRYCLYLGINIFDGVINAIFRNGPDGDQLEMELGPGVY
jgi:hypothetical protein